MRIEWYQIVNVFSAVASQLIVLSLVFALSAVEYGYYSLMIVVGQVLAMLVVGWNNALVLNFGTKLYVEKGYVKDIFKVRMVFVFVALPIILILYWFFFGAIGNFIKSDDYVELVLLYLFSEIFFYISSNVFYAKNKNLLQSIANTIPKLSQLIYILIFFVDVREFVRFCLVTNLFTCMVIIMCYLRDEWGMKSSVNKSDFAFYLKFGLLQFFSIASVYMINWGDNFALSVFDINIAHIGNYNLSYKIFLGFNVIFALLNIYIPKLLYKYKSDGAYAPVERLLSSRKIFIGTLGLLYALAIVVVYYFLKYTGKVEYLLSLKYAALLLVAFIFMCHADFIVPVIINTPFFHEVQRVVIIQAAINVIANFVFASQYGVGGVIIGTTIAYFYKAISLRLIFKTKVHYYLKTYAQARTN